MRRPAFLSQKFLIILGITLSVLAAALGQAGVAGANRDIMALRQAVAERAMQVDRLWQDSQRLGAERDTAILLLMAGPEDSRAADFARAYLAHVGAAAEEGPLWDRILAAHKTHAAAVAGNIDRLWLEKLGLDNDLAAREAARDRLALAALALQLVGLTLVLSRHLL